MEHSKDIKDVVVPVYEVAQIEPLRAYLLAQGIELTRVRFVALEYEVVAACKEKNISCDPLPTYVPIRQNYKELYYHIQDLARKSLLHPALSFYTSRGVALGETHIAIFQYYLDKLFHCFYIAEKILDTHPEIQTILVPRSTEAISPTFGPLVYYHVNAMATAWSALAAHRGLTMHEVGRRQRVLTELTLQQRLRRKMLTIVMRSYNFCAELCIPPKKLKIFVSDYWRHIKPFVEKMDDAEFILMDRSEAKHISFATLWKHRIRLYHPNDFATKEAKEEVRQTLHTFKAGWEAATQHKEFVSLFVYKDVSFWSEARDMFEFLITRYARRMVADTIYFKELYTKLGIDKVVLRASRSGQYHFYIAAKIAQQCNIPSIELQHAAAVIDPGQVFSLLDTSYLAGYGPLMREQYVKNHGYNPDQIRSIGSPRFDHYRSLGLPTETERAEKLAAIGLDATRPVLFASVPYVNSGLSSEFVSSFELIAFFEGLRKVKDALPELQIIFKFRPGNFSPFYQQKVQEMFTEGGVYITNNPNIHALLSLCDIACSNYSTIMYETMICKKALVLYPWKSYNYALEVYEKAGVYARDDAHLVEILTTLSQKGDAYTAAVARGQEFLETGYTFDGKAAERIVSLLHETLKAY